VFVNKRTPIYTLWFGQSQVIIAVKNECVNNAYLLYIQRYFLGNVSK